MNNKVNHYLKESYLNIDIERQDQYYYLSGFSIQQFRNDLRRLYRSNKIANVFEQSFAFFGRGTIKIHQFFIPELAYIMGQLPPRYVYQRVSELIFQKTWIMIQKFMKNNTSEEV